MHSLLYIAIAVVLALVGCKSRPKEVVVAPDSPAPVIVADTNAVIRKLAADYQNGQLTQCVIDSAMYFFGARNAPDAGAEIFDVYGKQVGTCYFSTNRVDPKCERAFGCADIYRIHPNIWGLPGVELKLRD